jgi:hypothetical protein
MGIAGPRTLARDPGIPETKVYPGSWVHIDTVQNSTGFLSKARTDKASEGNIALQTT